MGSRIPYMNLGGRGKGEKFNSGQCPSRARFSEDVRNVALQLSRAHWPVGKDLGVFPV